MMIAVLYNSYYLGFKFKEESINKVCNKCINIYHCTESIVEVNLISMRLHYLLLSRSNLFMLSLKDGANNT